MVNWRERKMDISRLANWKGVNYDGSAVNGIPVFIDKYLAKGTAYLIRDNVLLPNPHIRTDSVETIEEMIRLYHERIDNKFLQDIGVLPL
jgi:hypothetical protein